MDTEAAPTDEMLMQAYAAGDARAFETLYDHNTLAVWRYVHRSVGNAAVADDLKTLTNWAKELDVNEKRLKDAAKARYVAGMMMGHHDFLRAQAELARARRMA